MNRRAQTEKGINKPLLYPYIIPAYQHPQLATSSNLLEHFQTNPYSRKNIDLVVLLGKVERECTCYVCAHKIGDECLQ